MIYKLYLFFFLTIYFCCDIQAQKIDHTPFSQLLKKHVTQDGLVDYSQFIKDSAALSNYLKVLSKANPKESKWSKDEQKAFWINAYNAFTIKLILDYYPIKSIRDIGAGIQIPFINSPWDIKFILIGNERLDLNAIEHQKLRKQFNDPRLHMALVCASKSCPILLRQAYEPDLLEEQLNSQTRLFINDTYRNNLKANPPQISMIFRWYGGDFRKNGSSVISFINTYANVKLKQDAKLSNLEYNWTLNDIKK